MADFTATAHVFPSSNDLFGAGVAGDGLNMRESNLTDKWFASLFYQSCVISGLALPGSSGSLTLTIPTGRAYIAGRYLNVSATNVTCTPNATNHIYLKLTRDAGQNINAVKVEVNTTGSVPADAAKLGTAVCSGGAVTGTTDTRNLWFIKVAMLEPNITQPYLAKPCIGTPELKTATGSASVSAFNNSLATTSNQVDVAMNEYSFFPSCTYVTSGALGTFSQNVSAYNAGDPGTTLGRMRMEVSATDGGGGATISAAIRWRYITASDNPDVWVIADPATGTIIATWWSDDALPSGMIPVQLNGLSSMRLTAADLERLTIPSATIRDASDMIRDKGLKMQHLPFRALALLAGDSAPSSWLLKNAKLDAKGKLADSDARKAPPIIPMIPTKEA